MHLAPVPISQSFVVGDLQPHAAVLHHRVHLVDRLQQFILLVAHMHHDNAVISGHHAGELNEFFRLCKASGRVDQPQRHSAGAFFHALGQQVLHGLHLSRSGFAVVVSHYVHSDGAMAHKAYKPRCRLHLLHRLHIVGKAAPCVRGRDRPCQGRHIICKLLHQLIRQRCYGRPVLPQYLCSDALIYHLMQRRISENLQFHVAVCIDKAGGKRKSLRINDLIVAFFRTDAAYAFDHIARNGYISLKRFRASTIVNGCILN